MKFLTRRHSCLRTLASTAAVMAFGCGGPAVEDDAAGVCDGDDSACSSSSSGTSPSGARPTPEGESSLGPDVLEEFVGLADPVAWATDPATGRRYRHATSHELEANDWKPGTFLVEAAGAAADFSVGASAVQLLIPMTLSTTRTLDLVHAGVQTGHQFVQVSAVGSTGGPGVDAAEVATRVPTFNLYLSSFSSDGQTRDLEGAVTVGLSVRNEAEFLVLGQVERVSDAGTTVTRIEVAGGGGHWTVDSIGGIDLGASKVYAVKLMPGPALAQLPNNGSLCPFKVASSEYDPFSLDKHPCEDTEGGGSGSDSAPNECTNQVDDDGDGTVDVNGIVADPMCQHHAGCDPAKGFPPHTHTRESGLYYGLFGAIDWCTRNKGEWQTMMLARALSTGNVFTATVTGNDAYNDFVGTGHETSAEACANVQDLQAEPVTQADCVEAGCAFHAGECWPWKRDDIVRFSASKCWMLDTIAAADACQLSSGNCGPFAPGSNHVYPYSGLASPRINDEDWLAASFKDLEHAAKLQSPYVSIDYPLDLWMVVVRGQAQDNLWGGTSFHHGYGALINGNTHPQYPGSELTGAHEFGHIFGCDHCDAEWTESTDGSAPGWSVMATGGAGVECSKGTDKTVGRFGGVCSRRMINENLNVNQFNRRSGANAGPSFGYEL